MIGDFGRRYCRERFLRRFVLLCMERCRDMISEQPRFRDRCHALISLRIEMA
jgi:hypothetical protein